MRSLPRVPIIDLPLIALADIKAAVCVEVYDPNEPAELNRSKRMTLGDLQTSFGGGPLGMVAPVGIITEDGQAHPRGLGRLYAPDDRDASFPMRALVKASEAKQYDTRYWPITTAVLDQGQTPQCVAYAWTHFVLSAPVTHKAGTLGSLTGFAQTLYARAQQLDEWQGESYDGTSVRAGAATLTEQKRLLEYRWASTADEARDFVLTRGPVVLGTTWYRYMSVPDAANFIHPRGRIDGGHAYVAIGFSRKRDAFRILNSWGPNWGDKGRAWLSRRDVDFLLEDYGEACSGVEVKLAA